MSLQIELPDYDSRMAEAIHDTLIDADRLVRECWTNGFPNWQLSRVVFSGEDVHVAECRRFMVALAWTIMDERGLDNDELAGTAGIDAAHMLLRGRMIAPPETLAGILGVGTDLYLLIRNKVYGRTRVSMMTYWTLLGAKYREARLDEYRSTPAKRSGKWGDGRGFGHWHTGDNEGNFYAAPKPTES